MHFRAFSGISDLTIVFPRKNYVEKVFIAVHVSDVAGSELIPHLNSSGYGGAYLLGLPKETCPQF